MSLKGDTFRLNVDGSLADCVRGEVSAGNHATPDLLLAQPLYACLVSERRGIRPVLFHLTADVSQIRFMHRSWHTGAHSLRRTGMPRLLLHWLG